MKTFLTFLLVSTIAFSMVTVSGCEKATVTEKTEVKDRLGGGEKVEKTRVIETDDKVRVEREKMKIGHDGDVKEQEKTVTEGEKIR